MREKAKMETTYTVIDREILHHKTGEAREVVMYDVEVEPGRYAYQIWVKVTNTTFKQIANSQEKIAEFNSVVSAASGFRNAVEFLTSHNYEGTFS